MFSYHYPLAVCTPKKDSITETSRLPYDAQIIGQRFYCGHAKQVFIKPIYLLFH